MATKEESGARRNQYRCLECSAVTWFRPVEMRQAARAKCSGCGSILIEYVRSCNGGQFKQSGKIEKKPRTKRNWTSFNDKPPAEQKAISLRRIQNLHEEFKARRKYGIPLHGPDSRFRQGQGIR